MPSKTLPPVLEPEEETSGAVVGSRQGTPVRTHKVLVMSVMLRRLSQREPPSIRIPRDALAHHLVTGACHNTDGVLCPSVRSASLASQDRCDPIDLQLRILDGVT